jgi:type I restriction enzyme S subunit
MEGSTGRQRLSKEVLASRVIPFPPLPEQRKIAYILSTVQKAIEQQEAIIQTTTELKKALMQKLFTEGLRCEPQKETEIGWVPESWSVVKLGKLMSQQPKNGMYKPLTFYGDGVLILRIEDFSNEGDIVVTASNKLKATKDEIANYSLRQGDIVVNRVNSLSHLGKTAFVGELTETLLFESNMMRFRTDAAQALPEFVFRFLNSAICKVQIIGSAKRAVAQSSINQGNLKDLLIPIPDISIQQEIVHVIDTLVTKIELHRSRKLLLKDLFKSLLHQLMTAQIRVHNIDFDHMLETLN